MAIASCAVLHHRPLLAGADRQDRGLRRVDDGLEVPHAEHAEVGDREAAALELLRLQLAGAARAAEVLHLVADRRPGPSGRRGG